MLIQDGAIDIKIYPSVLVIHASQFIFAEILCHQLDREALLA